MTRDSTRSTKFCGNRKLHLPGRITGLVPHRQRRHPKPEWRNLPQWRNQPAAPELLKAKKKIQGNYHTETIPKCENLEKTSHNNYNLPQAKIRWRSPVNTLSRLGRGHVRLDEWQQFCSSVTISLLMKYGRLFQQSQGLGPKTIISGPTPALNPKNATSTPSFELFDHEVDSKTGGWQPPCGQQLDLGQKLPRVTPQLHTRTTMDFWNKKKTQQKEINTKNKNKKQSFLKRAQFWGHELKHTPMRFPRNIRAV